MDIVNLFLDVGLSSKEEILSFGINLGDMMLFDIFYIEIMNGKRWILKVIDNCFGCGLVLEVIEYFSGKIFDYNLIIGVII